MSIDQWKKDAAQMQLKAQKWGEKEWRELPSNSSGVPVFVDCAHPNCRLAKVIYAVSPITLSYAEKTASVETWYCHHHDDHAWITLRHIKHELLPYLKKLKDLGVVNKGKLGLKKRDFDFLNTNCLIEVAAIPKGPVNKEYEISLSKLGNDYLTEHVTKLAQYLSNQPKYQEIEWYAPYFLGYWKGGWLD